MARHHMPTVEECTANILNIVSSCTESEIQAWRTWYQEEHQWVVNLSNETGYPITIVAHVAAAMSPRVRWSLAKTATEDLLHDKVITVGLVANRTKAIACKSGKLDALRGPKVIPFAELLVNPYLTDRVVIDSWAIQVALGELPTSLNTYASNPARLKTFRQAYQTAAVLVANSTSGVMGYYSGTRSSTFCDSLATITPAEIQAITWCKVNPDYAIA